ncbi:MAG: PDZ domain-containing protein [Actinobacteria bacterium]|nr:MAG: PDZ domain-containing protein [Actinomycetota bacterium]REK35741.1 MAG: PDZ domain-containing protein [Actinomycetota bacterium]
MRPLSLRTLALLSSFLLVFSACTSVETTDTTAVDGGDLYDVSGIVERVSSGVVSVIQEQVQLDLSGNPEEVPAGSGTGIVVDEGRVITNAHVVSGADSVFVVSEDGRQRDAEVLATSVRRDLALLAVEDTEGLEPLALSDEEIEVGNPAIAMGNALGLNAARLTVSAGIISALGRTITTQTATIENLIQTDAAINPGNSGGPLLNGDGEVIGINTAIAGGIAQNVGFAIPISAATNFIAQFDAGEGEPFLGVVVADNSALVAQRLGLEATEGAVVIEVEPDTPAERAGLVQGDVIISFAGEQIETARQLTNAVFESRPGESVTVEILRPEGTTSVEVTLGERPLGN